MELHIDARQVFARALADLGPEEDFDEARVRLAIELALSLKPLANALTAELRSLVSSLKPIFARHETCP